LVDVGTNVLRIRIASHKHFRALDAIVSLFFLPKLQAISFKQNGRVVPAEYLPVWEGHSLGLPILGAVSKEVLLHGLKTTNRSESSFFQYHASEQ
jgi:hypothetical protein